MSVEVYAVSARGRGVLASRRIAAKHPSMHSTAHSKDVLIQASVVPEVTHLLRDEQVDGWIDRW
jgi:hypothetical protein